MEVYDESKIGDLLETPDYIGRVVFVDEQYVRIHILKIKTESELSKNDFLRNRAQTRPEDQISKKSDYWQDVKLLNVNWKDWLKVNGILNE